VTIRLPSLAMLALLLGPGPSAQAQETVTLTVHHFLSATAPTHAAFIEPWARRLEAESEGRLKFEIFPSMTLGGKAPELYQQVRDGVADIVWTVIGYTPGVFPRAEVFELPTVHRGSATVTNLAIQDIFDEYLAEDFREVQPILVHVHAGNALHTVDREVRAIGDVAGLKLRTPTRTGAWMIEAWGAEPVGMPLPEVPQALSRGVVDGVLIPFEVVLPLKIHEMTEYSVEGLDARRFGTAVFLFAMNRERYESLPEDLRALIDAHSGAHIAADAGRVWDAVEPRVKDTIGGDGQTLMQLKPEAMAAFIDAGEAVVERWIQEAGERGLDGSTLVAAARAAVERHHLNILSQQQPQ